jgi:hypothetical protein
MKRKSERFILFFLILSLTYTFLILLFNGNYAHLISLIAQVIALGALHFLYVSSNEAQVKEDNSQLSFLQNLKKLIITPFILLKSIKDRNYSKEVFIVVIGNAILGVMNILSVSSKIDFEITTEQSASIKNIFIFTNTIGVALTQVGGWLFQSYLVYMLSVIVGGTGVFKDYLKLIGLAYIGFFILSIVLLVFNYWYLPDNLSSAQFTLVMKESLIHKILGKIGEFWTLTLISFGLFNLEKFSFSKCVMVSFVPSFLLLVLNEFFGAIL